MEAGTLGYGDIREPLESSCDALHRNHFYYNINHFWISASLKSFCVRNEKIEPRRHDIKTLKVTDSKVICLKLARSSLLPFYELGLCKPFPFCRNTPDPKITQIMSVNSDRKYGHLLKQTMDILSKWQGGSDDFILRITLVTSSLYGGDWLKGIEGSGKKGIHVELV